MVDVKCLVAYLKQDIRGLHARKKTGGLRYKLYKIIEKKKEREKGK